MLLWIAILLAALLNIIVYIFTQVKANSSVEPKNHFLLKLLDGAVILVCTWLVFIIILTPSSPFQAGSSLLALLVIETLRIMVRGK